MMEATLLGGITHRIGVTRGRDDTRVQEDCERFNKCIKIEECDNLLTS